MKNELWRRLVGAGYARPHIIQVNVAEIIAKNATNNCTDVVVSNGMMGYMTIDLCWVAFGERKIAGQRSSTENIGH